MLRLPTKPKSTASKVPAMVRVLGVLALVGIFISGLETTVEAAENDLANFGLANLAPLAAREAEEIQCQSLLTEHFGISFISGLLYDPNTGSSIKAHSIELSSASDFVADSLSVNDVAISQVSWDRIAEIDIASSIVDFQASMRGLIQATGFALSTY